MKKGTIRPIAICLFQKDNTILVAEGYDSVKEEFYYRPIGGGIEFGEKSSDTLIREIKEELDADISNLQFLGTIESIFTFAGDTGHEIVQVYDGEFIDKSLYNQSVLLVKEDDGNTHKAMWKPLTAFQNGKLRLVPESLYNLLTK
ncbi:NUDIX hydrolase [Oceanobacillus sojae]|uniref:NUDIX hydrolase n=1 Tax=Oceanobacillus sojae TaxID=582851 RepID=UPI0009883C4B|nr:NUDIX hydrolase [Oceanobacillus sojae]MCT1902370.1 NUDIX hydrolase [Oceanobacillus sojae]